MLVLYWTLSAHLLDIILLNPDKHVGREGRGARAETDTVWRSMPLLQSHNKVGSGLKFSSVDYKIDILKNHIKELQVSRTIKVNSFRQAE